MPVELSAGSAGTAPSNPVVSVCMTTYNHAPYLAQAIEGVLAQRTSFDVELVLSDDCSTDGTTGVLLEYQRQHPSIFRVVTHEENQFSKGASPMGEFLVPLARGEYIAMCEGDDYWTDVKKLAKQLESMGADNICI